MISTDNDVDTNVVCLLLSLNVSASGLPNSFIIMHQNRYQQCIGVFILQAQTESMKVNMRSNIKVVTRSSLFMLDFNRPRL